MVVLYVFSQSNMTIVGKYQAHEDNNVNWEMAHPSMKDKAGNKLLNLAIEKEGAVSLKIKWNNIHELKFIRNRYLHISANDSMGMETNRPDRFTSMKRTIIADNA